MRGNRVTGLDSNVSLYPNSPDEGASKAYVDAQKQQILTQLPTSADNGAF